MIKIFKVITVLIIIVFINTSCSSFRTVGERTTPKEVPPSIKTNIETPTPKATGKYDIDLNQELTYGKEIEQVNQLNKMSIDTNNKTSQQQLMDSLFANKNRAPKDIKTSYLKIVRDKKRALRKRLTDKRTLFFENQKLRRKQYSEASRAKKERFRKSKHAALEKKQFYKNLDLERKHFFATESDEKKLFDSNLKSLEKEIDARFSDLDKEFESNLEVYKSTFER